VTDTPWHAIAADGSQLSEILYSLGPDGAVLQLSATFERTSGIPAAAVRDDPSLWMECVVDEDRPRLVVERERRASEGTPGEVVYRVRNRTDDRIRVVVDHAIPLADDAGKLIRIDGVLTDVTLRAAREVSEARQARLEVLGRLTTAVAHSFNNILTVISGYASALETHPALDPLEQRAVERIGSATERAAELARRLVLHARGDDQPGPRNVHPVRLLQEARDLLRGILSRAIELEVLGEPGLPLIHVDPLRITEALLHLATNAQHAMPQGGTLTLSARHSEPEGRLVLEMCDTGTGMPREVLDRVFDPYFTTRQEDGATGLGCPLARAIAEDHGGTLELFSTAGEGVRALLSLPVIEPRDEES